MKEKLIRVTSEAQLRAGLMLEELACTECGSSRERYMLLAPAPGDWECECCDQPTVAWNVVGGCMDEPALSCPIKEGRIFIVETGLDEQEAQREGRDMERRREAAR